MNDVRIVDVAVAHPERRVPQEEAARAIGEATGEPRRVAAIARATRIEQRAVVLPPDALLSLGTIASRNAIYQQHAPTLAANAATAVTPASERTAIGALVTSSCTGYTIPGWGVDLVQSMNLPCDTVRVPITESGCAGGVVALARAADFLRARPGPSQALAVAAELCTLAFNPSADEGNLTSILIFGDGAGAARLASGPGPGLRVIGTASALVPGTREALGFDLTDHGFFPILRRDLPDILGPATEAAVTRLLARHELSPADISAWLLHPGGARILTALQSRLGARPEQLRWSWASMREFGNTSSAAVFDVVRRYLHDPERPAGPALIAAFGPGVSIELMLVEPTCS